MKIPKSATYITGEQHKGYKQIDKFFNSIIEETIKLPRNHPNIEKRVMGMWRLYNEVKIDGRVHMLLYKQQTIATVIETRTNNNYVHFDYFQNIKVNRKAF